MKYITVAEASKKWGLTPRSVQLHCLERVGNGWGRTPRNARFTGLSAISALGTASKYVFARVLENCRDGQPLPRRLHGGALGRTGFGREAFAPERWRS